MPSFSDIRPRGGNLHATNAGGFHAKKPTGQCHLQQVDGVASLRGNRKPTYIYDKFLDNCSQSDQCLTGLTDSVEKLHLLLFILVIFGGWRGTC